MNKKYLYITITIIILLGLFLFLKKSKIPKSLPVVSTPIEDSAQQLSEDQKPKVSLTFSSDVHYVTVNITNIHADLVEYNLIYTATIKNNEIQTGVNASKKLNGADTYSEKQLLGSESSGHFTYHSNIHDASMELTLRDSQNRSIYTATYPFEVTAGKTLELTASQ